MLSDGVKRSRLIITFPSDQRHEQSKFSHKNSITGNTFLKPVPGFRTGNQLTGSRLTSLLPITLTLTLTLLTLTDRVGPVYQSMP